MRPRDQITMSVPTLLIEPPPLLCSFLLVLALLPFATPPLLHCSRSHRPDDGSDLMQWQGDEDQMRVSLLD